MDESGVFQSLRTLVDVDKQAAVDGMPVSSLRPFPRAFLTSLDQQSQIISLTVQPTVQANAVQPVRQEGWKFTQRRGFN
jgi:hypothetical protein